MLCRNPHLLSKKRRRRDIFSHLPQGLQALLLPELPEPVLPELPEPVPVLRPLPVPSW